MKKNVATLLLLMLVLIAGCSSNEVKNSNQEQSEKADEVEKSEDTNVAVAV